MTNSATTSTHNTVRGYAQPATRKSDGAPMIITRLSGWIDMGEARATPPTWIIRTRVNAPMR